MIVKISAESGLLHVVGAGEFSLKEAEKNFLEILDAAARHQTEKILIDGREIQGEPDIIQRFFYGTFVAHAVATYIAERGVPRAAQFAYVLHEPVLDPQRFGETVATNRGMWMKAFDNLKDAREWLKVAPADQPNA